MHLGDIVPHPEMARKKPTSLFRVWGYASEVNLCGPGALRRASSAFIAAGCLLGCMYLGCKCHGLLLGPERTLDVSIDYYNTVGSLHF